MGENTLRLTFTGQAGFILETAAGYRVGIDLYLFPEGEVEYPRDDTAETPPPEATPTPAITPVPEITPAPTPVPKVTPTPVPEVTPTPVPEVVTPVVPEGSVGGETEED